MHIHINHVYNEQYLICSSICKLCQTFVSFLNDIIYSFWLASVLNVELRLRGKLMWHFTLSSYLLLIA